MYTRKENIPEENLDWGKESDKSAKLEVVEEPKESKHVIHPTCKPNKIVLQKKVNFSQLGIKKTILNLLDEYGEVSLLLGLLIFPYLMLSWLSAR